MDLLVVVADGFVTNSRELVLAARTSEGNVLTFMLNLVRVVAKSIIRAQPAKLESVVDCPVDRNFQLKYIELINDLFHEVLSIHLTHLIGESLSTKVT